jgi:3-methyladenine DNA glycosylase Tag
MEGPRQIRPKGLNDYLEVMTKAVFQTGISWAVIEAKWDGFRQAFSGFDPEIIAELTPPQVDRLTQDTRIVRNRKKIEATVHNAATMVELDRKYGSFKKYLRSHEGFEATVADLRKRFKFMGDTGSLLLPLRRGRAGSATRGMDGLASGRPAAMIEAWRARVCGVAC